MVHPPERPVEHGDIKFVVTGKDRPRAAAMFVCGRLECRTDLIVNLT